MSGRRVGRMLKYELQYACSEGGTLRLAGLPSRATPIGERPDTTASSCTFGRPLRPIQSRVGTHGGERRWPIEAIVN